VGRRVLAQTREDARYGVIVGIEAYVGHRVHRERDMKAELVRVPRGRFDPDAGCHTCQHDLSNAEALRCASRSVWVNAPQVLFVMT